MLRKSFWYLSRQKGQCDCSIRIVCRAEQQQQHGEAHIDTASEQLGTRKLASSFGHRVVLSQSLVFRRQFQRQDQEAAAAAQKPQMKQTGRRPETRRWSKAKKERMMQQALEQQQQQQVQQQEHAQQGIQQHEEQQQPQQQHASEPHDIRSPAKKGSSSSSRLRQLVLTLDSEDQLPAAEAVVDALYATKPLPELLGELTHEQQLHVAMLADMWLLPKLCRSTVWELQVALARPGQLSAAATQQLYSLQAVPDCVLPLLRSMLAQKLGDLQAAWADPELKATILSMSVPVFRILLQYQLTKKVCVRDTLLGYLDNIGDADARQCVIAEMARLERTDIKLWHEANPGQGPAVPV